MELTGPFLLIVLAGMVMPHYARYCARRSAASGGLDVQLPPLDRTGHLLINLGVAAGAANLYLLTIAYPSPAPSMPWAAASLPLLLMAVAATDRAWFFAPLGLMIPITLLVVLISPIADALYWALAIWGASYLSLLVQIRFGQLLVAPPDLVALLLPTLMFDAGVWPLAPTIATGCLLTAKWVSVRFGSRASDRRSVSVQVPFCAYAMPILTACLTGAILCPDPLSALGV